MVKIVVSKPELSAQISEAVFVGFPFKIEVNRAVRAFLKNGPASTACDHVTEHLDWFAAIWIDGVHATRIKSILKQLRAALWFYCEEKRTYWRSLLCMIIETFSMPKQGDIYLPQGFPVKPCLHWHRTLSSWWLGTHILWSPHWKLSSSHAL